MGARVWEKGEERRVRRGEEVEGGERRGGSGVHRKGKIIVPFAERGELECGWKIPDTARIVVLEKHYHSKSPLFPTDTIHSKQTEQ